MAVNGHKPVKSFTDWYDRYEVDNRSGTLSTAATAKCAASLYRRWEDYRREMDLRVANYWKLVKLADAEVITERSDLANVSSGETAGMIRRMSRNLVQHTPNVEVISKFDDDSTAGIFTRWILKSKIIGDDLYSNDMQQKLFASTKSSLTLGYDCVIPVLQRDALNGFYVKYDNVFYRDVFPEPGAKDIRDAKDVFIRRYLTRNDVKELISKASTDFDPSSTVGWDPNALRTMLQSRPPVRQRESVDHQTSKHHQVPEGYEVITWYSNTGDAFLTFEERSQMLLRIELNKHPLKWHPVFFLIMENDLNQPLGKSQVELVLGRQEFQDLLLNGAMKLWYRNINPTILGLGMVNGIPNLSPGKFVNLSNPNSEIKPLEFNTQTLLQYGQISTQNSGNMVQMIGAADQQMASQSGGNGGMSQTPQGVEAQQAMVDITTNNYQKAIENFFSRYCSYALTIYFQELKTVEGVTPTADARQAMIDAGMNPGEFDPETGELAINFRDLAEEYWVRAVPGSLVEMEDEKQLRILKEIFVPLSQSMPALAQSGDQQSLANASTAMRYIVEQTIKLSGSAHSGEIARLFKDGDTPAIESAANTADLLEEKLGGETTKLGADLDAVVDNVAALNKTQGMMMEAMGAIMERLGISTEQPTVVGAENTIATSATPAPQAELTA